MAMERRDGALEGEGLPLSDDAPVADFVGRGLAFPMGVDHTGSIALSAGRDDIGRSMWVVLATAPGERLMRPDFGCQIWDLMFEPINPATLGAMDLAVREALAVWEPRAEIDDVFVEADPDHDGKVDIRVEYTVKATNDRRNLVYPFYVIPREEEED